MHNRGAERPGFDRACPLERGKALHGMIPGSGFRIIDDAGHLVIEEKPDELITEILDFIQAWKPHNHHPL